MGKTTNYQNGKVYELKCLTTGKVYIGSTIQKYLSARLAQHASDFKRWNNGRAQYMTSFEIIGGSNYQMTLLETCPCNSVDELHARERHWIESTECVNKVVPTRTHKEYREANREDIIAKNRQRYEQKKETISAKQKAYYEANKEKRSEQARQYREANKEKTAEYFKQYYDANRERIAEYKKHWCEANKERLAEHKKQYREANKERTTAKHDCECGGKYTTATISTHLKTKKHQEWAEKQSTPVLNDDI